MFPQPERAKPLGTMQTFLELQNPCILAIDYSVKVQTHADLLSK